MPSKKKLFTKSNSTKYILLHGTNIAQNADGETLPNENVLIPVLHNYRAGSSLLMAGLAPLCAEPADEAPRFNPNNLTSQSKEPDLHKILESFEDDASLSSELSHSLLSGIKMKAAGKQNSAIFKNSNVHVEILEEGSDCSDDMFGQFSDAEEDLDDFESGFGMSAIKSDCPETLQILNERFEKMYNDEYDDDQIGALDDEDIGGILTAECENVTGLAGIPLPREEIWVNINEVDEDIKEKVRELTEFEETEKKVEIIIKRPLEFDCETILSTYSNVYNHPSIISSESKIKKIQVPNMLHQQKLTKSRLKELESESESENDDNDDQVSVATSCNIRVKGETPEQKRERKQLFKEAKRDSRALKKENKLAFKNERKIQQAQALNVRRNMGIRLL